LMEVFRGELAKKLADYYRALDAANE
jgi:heat-inducible transcriptional repressor